VIALEISGEVIQIIPPDQIGGYVVPDELYRESLHHGYSLVVVRPEQLSWWQKLVRWVPPLFYLYSRYDFPFAKRLVMYDPPFEEGDEVCIDVEPFMIQLENTYRSDTEPVDIGRKSGEGD